MAQKMVTLHMVGGESTEIANPEAVEALIGVFSRSIDNSQFINVDLGGGQTLLVNPNLVTSVSIQEIEKRES